MTVPEFIVTLGDTTTVRAANGTTLTFQTPRQAVVAAHLWRTKAFECEFNSPERDHCLLMSEAAIVAARIMNESERS